MKKEKNPTTIFPSSLGKRFVLDEGSHHRGDTCFLLHTICYTSKTDQSLRGGHQR